MPGPSRRYSEAAPDQSGMPDTGRFVLCQPAPWGV
jgi:hypothetical protein